jgi:hypothetical protein
MSFDCARVIMSSLICRNPPFSRYSRSGMYADAAQHLHYVIRIRANPA